MVRPGFLDAAACAAVLDGVARWRAEHPLPLIHRSGPGRDLHYRVIDGEAFAAAVPGAGALVARVRAELEAVWGAPLAPLDDARAACNVNITPPGGEYRWHYDRNRATAIVYLNVVEGGETELYPGYRAWLPGGRPAGAQAALDRLAVTRAARVTLGRRQVIAPAPGALVALRGDRTLHSVRRVRGDHERVNLVLAFDEPGASRRRPALDRYLYGPGQR
ncbi:MAG: 2OG-Fe(II) oxygenase family protein [Acidimicrobiales bacterium]